MTNMNPSNDPLNIPNAAATNNIGPPSSTANPLGVPLAVGTTTLATNLVATSGDPMTSAPQANGTHLQNIADLLEAVKQTQQVQLAQQTRMDSMMTLLSQLMVNLDTNVPVPNITGWPPTLQPVTGPLPASPPLPSLQLAPPALLQQQRLPSRQQQPPAQPVAHGPDACQRQQSHEKHETHCGSLPGTEVGASVSFQAVSLPARIAQNGINIRKLQDQLEQDRKDEDEEEVEEEVEEEDSFIEEGEGSSIEEEGSSIDEEEDYSIEEEEEDSNIEEVEDSSID